MNFKSLLVSAIALLCCVGTWAQRDITSTYITNATLSNGTTGWTVSNFNAPQQGNNTIGYATEAYAGWGNLDITSYSLTQNITIPAGSYRLVNYSFFRQGLDYNTDASKSLAYLKAGSNQVAIKTLGSITAAGYANLQAEGANCFDSKMYRNVLEFTIDTETTMEIGVVGTFDLKQSWCIVGLFELFDMNDLASVSSPTDVTYAITNPGFEYRDLTGWTCDGFWYVGDNDNIGGKAGFGYIEYYRGSGLENNKYVSQTLTGLENGLYEVTVYGHQQQGTPNDGVKLYANSDYIYIGSTTKDYSVRTTVNNNELTIKIQTEGSTANWTAFDKFRLKFYGDPLAAYQDLLDAAVADAQALVNSNTIPDAAEAALQTIINANDNDDDAFTTESEFNTAIENINNAVSQYQDLVKPYALWLEAKSGAQALVLVDNNNATATSTLSGAIDTQNTAAEAATTSSDLNMATSALKSAILTFAGEADPTSGNCFDLTCLLTNHDLTGLPTWVGADGWFTDQVDGNSQVMTNDGVKSDDGDRTCTGKSG